MSAATSESLLCDPTLGQWCRLGAFSLLRAHPEIKEEWEERGYISVSFGLYRFFAQISPFKIATFMATFMIRK